MEPSDDSLLQACRQGDQAAWNTLVLRYQRLVYSIARRGGLDQEQATDVFQHVFMMLIRHIERIEQPERIGSWLTTVTKRETWRALQHRHATSATFSLDECSELHEMGADAPLPSEIVIQLEEQHRVRLALATLDERCRQLLTLLYLDLDAPSYADIAASLNLPQGSIGPTRARCLQKLRRLLDEVP